MADAPREERAGQQNEGYEALNMQTMNTTASSSTENAAVSDGYLEPVETQHHASDASEVSSIYPSRYQPRSNRSITPSYAEPYQFGPPRQREPVYQDIDE